MALVTMLAACGTRPPARDAPLMVDIAREASGTVLTLHPHAGLKINALLPPQLELADGSVSRFGGPRVPSTPDSAYFSVPPYLIVPSGTALAGALVRASVCDSGAAVCRVLTVRL